MNSQMIKKLMEDVYRLEVMLLDLKQNLFKWICIAVITASLLVIVVILCITIYLFVL